MVCLTTASAQRETTVSRCVYFVNFFALLIIFVHFATMLLVGISNKHPANFQKKKIQPQKQSRKTCVEQISLVSGAGFNGALAVPPSRLTGCSSTEQHVSMLGCANERAKTGQPSHATAIPR